MLRAGACKNVKRKEKTKLHALPKKILTPREHAEFAKLMKSNEAGFTPTNAAVVEIPTDARIPTPTGSNENSTKFATNAKTVRNTIPKKEETSPSAARGKRNANSARVEAERDKAAEEIFQLLAVGPLKQECGLKVMKRISQSA